MNYAFSQIDYNCYFLYILSLQANGGQSHGND